MTRRRSIWLAAVAVVALPVLGDRGASAAPPGEAGRQRSHPLEPNCSDDARRRSGAERRCATRVPDQHGHDPGRCVRRGQCDRAEAPSAISTAKAFRREGFDGGRRRDGCVRRALRARLDAHRRRAPFPGRARRCCKRSPPNTQPRWVRSTMVPSRGRALPQGTQQRTPCSRRERTTDGSGRLSGCPTPRPDTGGRSSMRLAPRSSTRPRGWAGWSRSSSRAPRSSAPRHRWRWTVPRTRRSSTRSRVWAEPQARPGRTIRPTSPNGGRARPC